MEQFRYGYPLRVRWVEVDAQQIVFNAHYLTYLDIAFAEYLRRGLCISEGTMLHTVIAKTTLEFRQPARYDDELTVWVRIASIGRTSLQAEFAVCRGEDELVRADTTYVHVDVTAGRPQPVPELWRQTISAYEPAFGDSQE